MAEPSAEASWAAGFHDPPVWPQPGEDWDTGDLASLALDWISVNRQVVVAVVGDGGDGWDAGDVISRMAWRAYRGRGLTRSLRAHVDGVSPIASPAGILRYHVAQMVRECVKESTQRRAHELPTGDVPDNGSYGGSLISASGAACDGYLQLIDALTDEAVHRLDDEQTLPEVVGHIQDRLPDIWKIFCRAAPPAVVRQVSSWPEEHRHVVLLAIFPLRLPHRAVASYRSLAWPQRSGARSVAATQRQISRLRARLQRMWPPELLPPQMRNTSPEEDVRPDRPGDAPGWASEEGSR